ncbi:MAG: hypothetical protein R6U59_02395 [Eubacteriales bacterium]
MNNSEKLWVLSGMFLFGLLVVGLLYGISYLFTLVTPLNLEDAITGVVLGLWMSSIVLWWKYGDI